jgi:cold shock CspA family protein
MTFRSGKHSEHQMPEKTEAAHLIAKLLAKRRTSIDEIPYLIENVERALSNLGKTPLVESRGRRARRDRNADSVAASSIAESDTQAAAMPVVKVIKPRVKRAAAAPRKTPEPVQICVADAEIDEIKPIETPVIETKPAPPTLVRRAEIIHVAPAPTAQTLFASAAPMTRGVVQWFDTRTNRGTLRLQGQSSDLPIDLETLGGFGLTRLFKGQEIEATVNGHDDGAKITALRILNASPASPVMGGMVRDRHAKQVVVELKREALSRTSARAEAEALLTRRAR